MTKYYYEVAFIGKNGEILFDDDTIIATDDIGAIEKAEDITDMREGEDYKSAWVRQLDEYFEEDDPDDFYDSMIPTDIERHS